MDRGTFLGRFAAVVMGIRAIDGEAIQQAFVEAVPFDDPSLHVAIHKTYMPVVDDILRNYYMPVVVEQLNSPSLLLMEAHVGRHTQVS